MNLEDQYSLSLIRQLRKHGLGDNKQIRKAMVFAKRYHEGQKRKSGEPYYMHPIAVAEMVLAYIKKEDVVAASILHDIVEDTIVTIEMIEDEFGKRVAEMVYRLTRIRGGEKLTIERIINESYLAGDKESLLIKICDRLHNLYTIEYQSNNKRHKIAQETLDYFVIVAMTCDLEIERQINMLATQLLAPDQLDYLKKLYLKRFSYGKYQLPSLD